MKQNCAISLILLAAIASGLLSCGGAGAGSDTTADTGTVDTTTEAPKEPGLADTITAEELEALGLDGYEVVVYQRPSWQGTGVYAEEENGEVFNDAVFRRNVDLEDKYGFTVTQIISTDTVSSDLQKFISAGDDTYDLAFPMARAAASISQIGGLADLAALDYVNLEHSCWNETFNRELNIGGHQYYVTGDISTNSFTATRAMLFNKDILEDYKL
ncbi:MAG: hypothetical protein E7632_08400, partial [Ruminococcaceae bacterium]|nr:hypothetical protein [Oscillospiraceae bacterium]